MGCMGSKQKTMRKDNPTNENASESAVKIPVIHSSIPPPIEPPKESFQIPLNQSLWADEIPSEPEQIPLQQFEHPYKIIPYNSLTNIYFINKQIANLPFGTLRRCIHKKSGLERTIKTIRFEEEDELEISEEDIQKEVNTLRILDHPNILSIYDLLFDSKNYFVIMESWEGGNLFEVFKKKQKVTENEIANIAEELFSALRYAHARKVIHRDLHPGVIYIMEKSKTDLWLKIGEMGSSAYVDANHKFEGKLSSAFYVAPEVLEGCYNEKSDLWSVGVILYTLFTGNPPFTGTTQEEIAENMKTVELDLEPLLASGASQSSIELIEALLEKNLDYRISAAEACESSWIQNFKNSNLPEDQALINTLDKLRQFSNTNSLRDGISAFFTSQVLARSDIKDMHDIFKALDLNADGILSKEELLSHYSKIVGNLEAEDIVEEFFEEVDTDHSGTLEYTEFLKATADEKLMKCKRNLEMTFRMIDTDESGKISADELARILEGEPFVWGLEELIGKADINQDGEIDFKEFMDLLLGNNN